MSTATGNDENVNEFERLKIKHSFQKNANTSTKTWRQSLERPLVVGFPLH